MTTLNNAGDLALQAAVPRLLTLSSSAGLLNLVAYRRTSDPAQPNKPTTAGSYNTTTGVLTGVDNGWTLTPPDYSTGNYLWQMPVLISTAGTSVAIPAASWGTPVVLSKDNSPTGGSLVQDMGDAGWIAGDANPVAPVAYVTDGLVNNTVRRSAAGVPNILAWKYLVKIQPGRVYRVRFYARAASGTNGALYHDLRQHLADGTNATVNNSGRSTYKPVAAAAHTDWREYISVWDSSDWQPNVTQVQPDFLLNYQGTAGYWEINGYTFTDVTDSVSGGKNLYNKTLAIAAPTSDGSSLTTRTATGFVLHGINANTGVMRLSGVIPKNGYYTISFDLLYYVSGAFPLTIDMGDGQGQTINPTTSYAHYSLTFNVTSGLGHIDFNGLSGQDYSFVNFKVEAGNKETPYSLAPEDISAAAAAAQAVADAATARLVAFSADNVITPLEKSQLILDFQTWNGEFTDIEAKANALSVNTSDLYSTKALLNNYLQGIIGAAWNDPSGDTTVDPTVYRSKITAYTTARQNLINATAYKASLVSTWAGTTGTGKPMDNANFTPSMQGGAMNDDPMLEAGSNYWTLIGGTVLASGNASAGVLGPNYFVSNALDSKVFSSRRFPINPARVYNLVANIFSGTGNARACYLLVDFYDAAGQRLIDVGITTTWGGAYSGYVYSGLGPANATWQRLGAPFGPGTNFAIPAQAASCVVGFWFQYGSGSGLVTQAVQDIRLTDINDAFIANAAIARISDDNWISASEKPDFVREYSRIGTEVNSLVDQADKTFVSRTAFWNAYLTLSNYLPVGSTTLGTDTAINGPLLRSYFLSYYAERDALRNALNIKFSASNALVWANVRVTGNSVYKDTTGQWNGSVYSKANYQGAMQVSFVVNETNTHIMIGISKATGSGAHNAGDSYSYEDITFKVYLNAGDLRVYQSASPQDLGSQGTYATGDTISIILDGTRIYAQKNGTTLAPFFTVLRPDDQWYLDSSFYEQGGSISALTVTPITNKGLNSRGTATTPDNILPDPQFLDLAWWKRNLPNTTLGDWRAGGTGWKLGTSLYIYPSGEQDTISEYFPMTPGATYRVEIQVSIPNGFDGAASILWEIPGVVWHSMGQPTNLGTWPDGTSINYYNGSPKGLIPYSVTYTVPDNTYTTRSRIRIHTVVNAGFLEFGSISITRVADAALIGPNAITAPALAPGAVTDPALALAPLTIGAFGDINVSVFKPKVLIGDLTPSISGGKAPYRFDWSTVSEEEGDGQATYAVSGVTYPNDHMLIYGICVISGGTDSTDVVTCTVTDANGRTATTQFRVTVGG